MLPLRDARNSMRIKDMQTGEFLDHAQLWLDRREDVERLRELVAAYELHFGNDDRPVVVSIPFAADETSPTT
jgi:hypothetical protein